MKQYSTSLNDSDKSDGDAVGNKAESVSLSDYATSDVDSAPGASPRNMQPISMTAFDLIGIVSTQMLNNVFTRSLQDTSQQMRTFTRFVSSSTPPKILYAIQEAVHRIADCTCRVASDRYEIKVVKRKGHRIIHINIQIFQTPEASKYMIECRRTQGNIFKYHEFFEEFEKQYKNVIQHLHKTNPDATGIIPPQSPEKKRKGQQIKFRRDSADGPHNRSVSAITANNMEATAMDVIHGKSTGSQSVPMGQSSMLKDDTVGDRKSSASSEQKPSHSHHSSVSEQSQSEQKENLNLGHSSASPSPTHQHTHSNASSTLTDEDLNQLQPHSDSSLGDEMEVQ